MAVAGNPVDRRHRVKLWADLVHRLPHPYNAVPLFLAGWCAYRQGNDFTNLADTRPTSSVFAVCGLSTGSALRGPGH